MNNFAPATLCMVIGDPVDYSLSPFLHNTGYKILGINDSYFYFKRTVTESQLASVMNAVRTLNIRGVSVTAPLKQTVLKYVDEIEDAADEIGAVNTVVNTNGTLKGYNTDWIGIQKPLIAVKDMSSARVLIIGAGGAARAAAYALKGKTDSVIITSRTYENARNVADIFGFQAKPLTILSNLSDFDTVLLAIPSGQNKEIKRQLETNLRPSQLLFDFAYAKEEVHFLNNLWSNGIQNIDGYEMLLYQGLEQFLLFTEKSAPEQEMLQAMRTYLAKESHD